MHALIHAHAPKTVGCMYVCNYDISFLVPLFISFVFFEKCRYRLKLQSFWFEISRFELQQCYGVNRLKEIIFNFSFQPNYSFGWIVSIAGDFSLITQCGYKNSQDER